MWIHSIYTCVNTCNVFGTAKILQNQFCRITLELTWAHVLLRLKQQTGLKRSPADTRRASHWVLVKSCATINCKELRWTQRRSEQRVLWGASWRARPSYIVVNSCSSKAAYQAWSLTHQCASQQLFSQRQHKMWGWCTGLLDINTLSSCALSGLISCHVITTPGYLVHLAEFKSNRKPNRVQLRSLKCHRWFFGGLIKPFSEYFEVV